ncbi:MAG: beta-N-acetylhexosaminidase, partial [Sphingobacteriaceae bacterium]
MKKIFFLLLFPLLQVQISFAQENTDPNLGIIPAPVSIKKTDGVFRLGVFIQLQAIGFENPSLVAFAKNIVTAHTDTQHIDYIQPNMYYQIVVNKKLDLSEEGYRLSIRWEGVRLEAKTERGLFYGLQTLLQLCPQKQGYSEAISLPLVEIEDYPRYAYRGMHLDVGRHFFPVSFIKQYIDLLAQYKLNTFHWHLTEDQGWRIEIKKYPKLTQIGSYRNQTLIGNYHDRFPQWFDNMRYGGFYTQEEVKEVVAYANSKFVTVIPEIEMPGHSVAALAAYPELACGDNPGPFKVAEGWGVFVDVYCAGKENTFTFLEDVLSEVMDLFPSQYIHIGGDECPKVKWKGCAYCQKRIRDKKLRNEHELQSYFIQRIEKFVNSKGRKIIGWDEILEGGLAPN